MEDLNQESKNHSSLDFYVEDNFPVNEDLTLAPEKYGPGFDFNKIVTRILSVGAFLIPLFFLPWTSDFLEFQKQTLLIGLAGAGLIFWLVGVIKSGVVQMRTSRLGLPVVLLLVAVFISSLFSLESFRSFFGSGGLAVGSFASMTAFIVFFFLIVFTAEDGGRQIVKLLTLSFIIALLFGTLQSLGLFLAPFSFIKSRAFTTLGSLNLMGALAAVMLPLLVGNFGFNKTSPVWKYVKYVGVGLAIFILILINWWILWAIAIIGLAIFVASHSFAKGFKPRKFILPTTLIVVGIFMMLVNFNLGFLKRGLPLEVAPSFNLSFDVLKASIKESPAFGYGPENFVFAFDKFGSKAIVGTAFSDFRFFSATSEFITFAVQSGLVGVAALAYLLVSLVMMVLKNAGEKRNIGGSALAFVAALFTAYFLYPFNFVLMFVFWVGLAVLVLNVEGESKRFKVVLENSPRYSLVSSVAFIVGLVLVLTGSYYTVVRYIADIKFVKAATSADGANALNYIVGAINLNPNESRYYRFGSSLILSEINKEIQKRDDDPQRQNRVQNLVQGVFDITKRATDRSPHDGANWSQRALAHQNLIGIVGGVEDLAIQYYQEALKRTPNNPVVYNRIGQVYLSRSEFANALAANQKSAAEKSKLSIQARADLERAGGNFKKATEINGNFGVALYNLGIVYERQGKIKESISQLEKIVPFNANNAGLAFELGLLYYRDDRKDLAFRQMRRAVQILPEYSNAMWFLALIHEERNELKEAIAQLERILAQEQNKDNQLVHQKLSDLRAGKRSIPPEKVVDQKPLEP